MLRQIKYLFLIVLGFVILFGFSNNNVSAQCAQDCICVQNGSETYGSCNGGFCNDGPAGAGCSCTVWGPSCGSATPPTSGGGGPASCRNATVNCPANSTIAINQPLYTVCEQDFGGGFCSPAGSAQVPTGCCVASGQNGCANVQYTTYACCSAGTVDTCSLGGTYTKINGCSNPTSCNDDDVYISYTRSPSAGVCGQECTDYKPDGECRAGAYQDVYGFVTTCQTKTCSCVSNCTSSAPAAPTLTSPANGSTITTDSVVLSWTQGSWGTGCPTNSNQFNIYAGTTSTNLAFAGSVGSGFGSILVTTQLSCQSCRCEERAFRDEAISG